MDGRTNGEHPQRHFAQWVFLCVPINLNKHIYTGWLGLIYLFSELDLHQCSGSICTLSLILKHLEQHEVNIVSYNYFVWRSWLCTITFLAWSRYLVLNFIFIFVFLIYVCTLNRPQFAAKSKGKGKKGQRKAEGQHSNIIVSCQPLLWDLGN